jgi:AhpC/TSA family
MSWISAAAAVLAVFAANAGNLAFPPHVSALDASPLHQLAPPGAKAAVVVFLSVDCPIANAYAPEYRRLKADFAARGVVFYGAYCDPAAKTPDLLAHAKDFDIPFEMLRDPRQELARLAHASVTPEAAVFLPSGALVYHGRIDDRYVKLGLARPEATRRDLRDALEAVVSGKTPKSSFEHPVGCSLPPIP